jgi:hypothetical protein
VNEGAGGVMAFSAGLRIAPRSCFDCSAPRLATTGEGGTSGRLAQHETNGLSTAGASLSVLEGSICMSPISIPSCPEAEVGAFCMAQPGMFCMLGQNAVASTCPQPLTKSREMTEMSEIRFIAIFEPIYYHTPTGIAQRQCN